MKMSIVDNMFFSIETRQTPMHVAGLQVFKIPDNYEGNFTGDLVQKLRNQRKVGAPFDLLYKKSLRNLGMPSYVRDKRFDLDYHLMYIALPKPGTMDQLRELAARLHGSMLDRTRPLWEYYIIDGLEGNRFAIYNKVHHAQFDGKAALRTMYATFSEDPEDFTVRPFWQMAQEQWENDTSNGSNWNMLESIPLNIGQQLKNMSELTRHWAKVGRLKQLFNDDLVPLPYEAPRTVFNNNITGQRIFQQTSVSLDKVKQFSKATSSTVNDVALAICSGAMRRYLLERRELPDKSLIGFVPVALPPKEGAGANRTTGLQCNLGTDIDDPQKRFDFIKASMERNKQLAGRLSDEAFQYLPMAAHFPYMISSLLKISDKLPIHPLSVTISNVPGSRKPLYFCGAKLEALYPLSALTHGNALNITLSSHENKLFFGILSCRSVMPDLDMFATYMIDSFNELMATAIGQKKSRQATEMTVDPKPNETKKENKK